MTESARTRILLVDDESLVRESIAVVLQSDPTLEVVAKTGDGKEAVAVARATRPDIAILDVDMPGLTGFEVARRLEPESPDCRIVFLSSFVLDQYIEEAIEVRARGYISKNEMPASVVGALKKIASGETYFSPQVWSRLTFSDDGLAVKGRGVTPASRLTIREIEILRYIARSMSRKEIADIASISPKTVDMHLSNLMGKLGIHDRVELTRFAIREGFVTAGRG